MKRFINLLLAVCVVFNAAGIAFALEIGQRNAIFLENDQEQSFMLEKKDIAIAKSRKEAVVRVGGGSFSVKPFDKSLSTQVHSQLSMYSTELGFRIVDMIQPALELAYTVEIPEQWYLDYAPLESIRSKLVVLYNAEDVPVAVFLQPDVVDQEGVAVDTSFEIEGSQIRVVTHDKTIDYPLQIELQVLSANTYFDFFYESYWINRDGEISLSIYYKDEAFRGNGSVGIAAAVIVSWPLLVAKHSSHNYWYNESGLYNQYQCHANYVFDVKNPWNIEPWRPNPGYALTVTALCNP